jgi:hypothetical protein
MNLHIMVVLQIAPFAINIPKPMNTIVMMAWLYSYAKYV